MSERMTCAYWECEEPATVLLVNTQRNTWPFKSGAACVCEPHAVDAEKGKGGDVARVPGWTGSILQERPTDEPSARDRARQRLWGGLTR